MSIEYVNDAQVGRVCYYAPRIMMSRQPTGELT